MGKEIYDLRSFIQKLDEEGELARVKTEVDWKYELGAVVRKVFGPPPGPALLFENIKDYDTSVFTGGLHTLRRVAIALGLEPDIDETSLIKEYTRRIEKPLNPTIVKNGPCKENKLFGDNVDVLKFPVPWWAERDGGRYIGTWHQVVVKDPDTDWVNVGTHRMMVHEGNVCSIQYPPFQHTGIIFSKFRKMNRPMPVAITIGNDPVAMIVSAAPFPAGVSEWTMAGALRSRPIELVKCETVDLEVPAYSEIVLEGEVPLDEQRQEGPFAEHTGFYGAGVRPLPVVRLKCITHRNNPIFRGTTLGRPITEDSRVTSINMGAQAPAMYSAAGLPGVNAVHFPPGGDPWFCGIVSLTKSYPSHALDAGRLLLSSKVGKFTKLVIVVDDDIDIYNFDQVLWALNTRFQAGRDLYVTHTESGSRLDPSVSLEYIGFTDKMIMDATWPTTPDFPPREDWDGMRDPPEVKTSEEMKRLVEKRWKEYRINMA
ncbi:UbiD family decarboxylase [Chloroflexota bacterium]